MGDISDYHVHMLSAGKLGIPIYKKRNFPTTTKEAIKDCTFYVVEVIHGNTNRIPGTKLIVCENKEDSYWVYTSKKVTGISKDVCKILSPPLSLDLAKEFRSNLLNDKRIRKST